MKSNYMFNAGKSWVGQLGNLAKPSLNKISYTL
jgi:hypothetical protein